LSELKWMYTTPLRNRVEFCHPEDAAQLWRYVGDLACSATGGIHNYGAFHGGGSPIMEAIAITSQYDIESRKKLVKQISRFALTKGLPEPTAKSDAPDAESEGPTPDFDDPKVMRAMSELERDMEHLDENNPRHMAHVMKKMKEASRPARCPRKWTSPSNASKPAKTRRRSKL
jgi:hypothetical protein